MENKIFKGYSVLFYFLATVVCFFGGLFYAGFTGAGKNQGLAGGAIVLSYGVVAGVFALIFSFFLVAKLSKKVLARINMVLAALLIGMILVLAIKLNQNGQLGYQQNELEPSSIAI